MRQVGTRTTELEFHRTKNGQFENYNQRVQYSSPMYTCTVGTYVRLPHPVLKARHLPFAGLILEQAMGRFPLTDLQFWDWC